MDVYSMTTGRAGGVGVGVVVYSYLDILFEVKRINFQNDFKVSEEKHLFLSRDDGYPAHV